YKNCPPGICKRCYHSHVWAERPRRNREVAVLELEPFEPEPWRDPDGVGADNSVTAADLVCCAD
ncbi:MAG: hypothetical protein ACRDOU_32720, partial [Streptosporangiaceae bacterium]